MTPPSDDGGTVSLSLDERLLDALRRSQIDYDHALQERTRPSGRDRKGRPVYTAPTWSVEDMAGGPHGERPEFKLDMADDELSEALLRFYGLVEGDDDFDYRRPDSGATDDERRVVGAFMERVIDTFDLLTENQRQAMIDWVHWKLSFRDELKVAANIEVQQALAHLTFLTGTPRRFESDTLRMQKIRGLPSDDELRQAYEAESSRAGDEAQELIESLKWEGILDEDGQPRTQPLRDMSKSRRGREPYHPEVHAEFTGWQPGDGGWDAKPDPSEERYSQDWFAEGFRLGPPGERHPNAPDPEDLDPHNPPRIRDYTGTYDASKRNSDQASRDIVITSDLVGLQEGLQFAGIALRHDERSASIQYTPYDETGAVWFRLDDNSSGALWDDIARLCLFQKPSGALMPARFLGQVRDDSRNALEHVSKCDAFQADYLDRLPDWNGEPLVDSLLQTAFSLDLTHPDAEAMSVFASRHILIGAVMRTREPGAKLDEMTVLMGGQGCGKSMFCAHLVPNFRNKRQEWFSDALVLRSSGQHRDQAQSLMGRVVVECAEMAGLSRADMDGLKAFLSRQVDHVRLPYDRLMRELPRRCVIIGTSNDAQPLPNDPTGLRRFLPVKILGRGARPIDEYLASIRDQLWAEAVYRFDMGERPILDDATRALQHRLTEVYRRSDEVVEELVAKYVAGKDEVKFMEVLAEVADKTERLKPQNLEGRTRIALQEQGFQTLKAAGHRIWRRPEPSVGEQRVMSPSEDGEPF